MFHPHRFLAPALVAAVLSAGCSRSPAPPQRLAIEPAGAAAEALKLHDTSGDGKLDAKELEASPPLQVAQKRIDTDGDGALSADEIAARIRSWADSKTIVASGTVIVTLDGKPLEGATVVFEPEPFLGPAFKPCTGTTHGMGYADLSGQNAEYPGIYLGLYRVRISKEVGGKETLPERYNSDTELGYESATDLGGIGTIQFDLKSGG